MAHQSRTENRSRSSVVHIAYGASVSQLALFIGVVGGIEFPSQQTCHPSIRSPFRLPRYCPRETGGCALVAGSIPRLDRERMTALSQARVALGAQARAEPA